MRSVPNIYLLFSVQPVITDGFVACTRSGRHLTLSLSRRCRRPCLSVSVSQLVLSPLVWVTPLYIVNATSASPPRHAPPQTPAPHVPSRHVNDGSGAGWIRRRKGRLEIVWIYSCTSCEHAPCRLAVAQRRPSLSSSFGREWRAVVGSQ